MISGRLSSRREFMALYSFTCYQHKIGTFSTDSREFKITTTATATGTSLNKRFNEQNNGSARAL